MLGIVYSILVISYISYVYMLLLSKEENIYPTYEVPFSVVIPCYNEGKQELWNCVESIKLAHGDKEIILVDNNSTKLETLQILNYYKSDKQVVVLSEERQGKRFAHSKGLNFAKNEIIVFVDSDTIVGNNAFRELIKPLQDETVGGVAGQVKLANENKNLLTKCIASMFWTSCNIYRKATTNFGYMAVISGCLGAYRKSDLLKLEYDYVNHFKNSFKSFSFF